MLYAIFSLVGNIYTSFKELMPISIDYYLPSINLHISNPKVNKNRMRMLVDISDTMNSENLNYHPWVMSQCPIMVDEYFQCSKDTAYDMVKLLATLDLKDTN